MSRKQVEDKARSAPGTGLDALVAERATVREEIAGLDNDPEVARLRARMGELRPQVVKDPGVNSLQRAPGREPPRPWVLGVKVDPGARERETVRADLKRRVDGLAPQRRDLAARERELSREIAAAAQRAYMERGGEARAKADAALQAALGALDQLERARAEAGAPHGVEVQDRGLAIARNSATKAVAAIEAPQDVDPGRVITSIAQRTLAVTNERERMAARAS